jgi:homocysteine S-methyltransferase
LSRQGFLEIGLTAADADEALRASITVARQAATGTSTKVAASVGPYGAVLHDGSEYRGHYSVGQSFLEDFHAERIEVLLQEQPDLLAIETIPNLVEARALKNVLKNLEIPRWISFTSQSAEFLWSGEAVNDAIAEVADLNNLVAIGFNCVDPVYVSELVRKVKSLSNVDAIAYPNRGGHWDSENATWIGETPKSLTDWLPDWELAGLNFVGGCCGTDALDIRELSEHISVRR